MTPRATTGVPPDLPGDCQPIPQVKTEVRDARGHIGWVVETHIVPGLDLDGQGSPVVLVPPANIPLNQAGMWWRLFIQRGDCGYELGVVSGMEDPMTEPDSSHGLHDFSMAQPVGARAGLQGIGMTVYAFDGTRYVGGRTEYR